MGAAPERVVTFAAEQPVVAAPAEQPVVAVFTVQPVVIGLLVAARSAVQRIVAFTAFQPVGPGVAGQYVVPVGTDQVDDIRHLYCHRPTVISVSEADQTAERIALGVAAAGYLAVQADGDPVRGTQVRRGIRAGPADQPVGAGAALQCVAAAAAVQDIVAALPENPVAAPASFDTFSLLGASQCLTGVGADDVGSGSGVGCRVRRWVGSGSGSGVGSGGVVPSARTTVSE